VSSERCGTRSALPRGHRVKWIRGQNDEPIAFFNILCTTTTCEGYNAYPEVSFTCLAS
jgi:hypothetical protein